MSKEFAKKEVQKIIESNKEEYPKNIALASTWILADYKGLNLKIIDMQSTSSLADYYVLASSENTTAARAMAEAVQYHMKGISKFSTTVEGIEDAEWILIDLGDIIVHIFLENVRDIFDLDNLWRDNPTIEIPQEYYFNNSNLATEKDTTDQYF